MKLLYVLLDKSRKNYVWIYITNNFYYVKIGKNNNTLFDILVIDYNNLHNILYILLNKNKTHTRYWVDIQLFQNITNKIYMIN